MGVAGSGKDYCAKLWEATHLKFADLIVHMTSDIYQMNLKDPSVYEEFKKDKRFVLQNLGESLKKRISPFIFVEHTAGQVVRCVDASKKDQVFVISDCRYPGEIKGLRDILYSMPVLEAEEGFEILYYFTDFHSERYNPNLEHKSEKFAQFLIKKGVTTGFIMEPVLNAYIEEFLEEGGEYI